ncbi:hypothetical protein B0H14DRAFT_2646534 [Mycena olivaceomarginata]|nr:hypothetical protein B0H14DRAFT_2646534 [Mycena olivaceomarginata]
MAETRALASPGPVHREKKKIQMIGRLFQQGYAQRRNRESALPPPDACQRWPMALAPRSPARTELAKSSGHDIALMVEEGRMGGKDGKREGSREGRNSEVYNHLFAVVAVVEVKTVMQLFPLVSCTGIGEPVVEVRAHEHAEARQSSTPLDVEEPDSAHSVVNFRNKLGGATLSQRVVITITNGHSHPETLFEM